MASTNAAPLPTGGPTAGGDEFDDLFDYEIDGENDPFSENYKLPSSKEPVKASSNSKNTEGANLGIDEEIEVTRKPRVPRVKLDEHRLLSANGIPKLRKKAKSELKLKGKGHEYSDAARLLAFYQLWLDDLFPKARFLDALAMVEKMGHKKMLQVARMEWINEGRPKPADEDMLYDDQTASTRQEEVSTHNATRIAPIFEKRAGERPRTPVVNEVDEDMIDLYDATPKAAKSKPQNDAPSSQDSLFGGTTQSIFGPRKTAPIQEAFDEDDLDALLAEEDALQAAKSAVTQTKNTAAKSVVTHDSFDDEMEAMAEMDGMW